MPTRGSRARTGSNDTCAMARSPCRWTSTASEAASARGGGVNRHSATSARIAATMQSSAAIVRVSTADAVASPLW